jgi:hypothetical protein
MVCHCRSRKGNLHISGLVESLIVCEHSSSLGWFHVLNPLVDNLHFIASWWTIYILQVGSVA